MPPNMLRELAFYEQHVRDSFGQLNEMDDADIDTMHLISCIKGDECHTDSVESYLALRIFELSERIIRSRSGS